MNNFLQIMSTPIFIISLLVLSINEVATCITITYPYLPNTRASQTDGRELNKVHLSLALLRDVTNHTISYTYVYI